MLESALESRRGEAAHTLLVVRSWQARWVEIPDVDFTLNNVDCGCRYRV
jgi:hypothetical protein